MKSEKSPLDVCCIKQAVDEYDVFHANRAAVRETPS